MAWGFGKKRKKGGGEEPPAKGAADAQVGGRREFFRLGFDRMKDGGVDALRAVAKASRAMQDAFDGVEEEAASEAQAQRARYERDAAATRAQAQRPPQRVIRGVVRPPGALAEADFLAACDGCKKCIEACPEDVIVASTESLRSGRIGTPLLRVQSAPCALCADVPCASACPTGALEPVAHPHDIRIGVVVVFRSLCLNGQGEPCEICVDHCPLGEAVMTRDADGFPVVNAETCTGCGQCVVRCPTYPAALHVSPR